jgi:hypothetical protein
MLIEPTGILVIDSINRYLELLSEGQRQEILDFTENLFTAMFLKKIGSLPPSKQCEVLDFIDYLIERIKD